jgi:hypothetical protein
MTRSKKIKSGMLVKAYDEELRYMGVGFVVRPIDDETEWDLRQGGDWWVLLGDGETYVFMGDDLDPIAEEKFRNTIK